MPWILRSTDTMQNSRMLSSGRRFMAGEGGNAGLLAELKLYVPRNQSRDGGTSAPAPGPVAVRWTLARASMP